MANAIYKKNGWENYRYTPCSVCAPRQFDHKKKSVLAVINPHSGSGKAIKAFKTIVEPEWKRQNVSYQILITEYAGHSTQLLSQDSLIHRYDSIVAVGGDGTLAEINNGLKKNRNAQNNNIKFGIIPVGSGNGLFKSLRPNIQPKLHIQESAKITSRTCWKAMDLMKIILKKKEQTAFLAITLGMIADIDIQSERLRCLGEFRFTLGAIWNIWKNKAYKVELSYQPTECSPSTSDPHTWPKISGNITHLMISNTSHCSSTAHTAPGAEINDGFLHVTVVKTVSAWTRFKLLLNLESGAWVQDPSVIRFKTRELHIDKISNDAILTIDGERVASQPLTCRIQQQALPILCS